MNQSDYLNQKIFDVLYGFIDLTAVEAEIIYSPFYQRLKWIKQVGFSFYSFPGAEHSRFAHSIGVMFNAHKIWQAIGKGVTDNYLFNSLHSDDQKAMHQSVRLAALLHDLGTFPFSHTTEMSYIAFGKNKKKNIEKGISDDHEHLGSYIIKNSDYPGGLTYILKKYKIDPQNVSNMVKGKSSSILANSVLHSEVDCDRMDYLLRDAHYTGLKYGAYDRDYLLHHFTTMEVGGHEVFAIKEGAIHCVEDFLMSRFAWYSQVVRSSHGAMYDAIAEEITTFLLEKNYLPRYEDLLSAIDKSPHEFFNFYDSYFMHALHKLYYDGTFKKESVRLHELAGAMLTGQGIRTVKCKEFGQKILNQDNLNEKEKVVKVTKEKIEEINQVLKKHGGKEDWLLVDLPQKDIVFTKSRKRLIKQSDTNNVLLERDPVKILTRDGQLKLLTDMENSIINTLQNSFNYIPHVYASYSAYDLLKSKKII